MSIGKSDGMSITVVCCDWTLQSALITVHSTSWSWGVFLGAFSCAHSVRFVPRFSPRAASETESWKSWSRAKNFPVFRGSKSRPIPPKVDCVASYAEIYTLCKNLHPPTFALEGKKPSHPRSCCVHGQERVSMSCRCVSTLCLGSDSPYMWILWYANAMAQVRAAPNPQSTGLGGVLVWHCVCSACAQTHAFGLAHARLQHASL